ncbi:MAG: hypothetical protein AUH30_02945 [Candidatus Rokubacteria bacterium 13_1_40CM_68_15]|nr:MAG: hypothetical protein AUH30_02945 [Candidatus Rokubacteria bacterium 13_1_40CM_68_15]
MSAGRVVGLLALAVMTLLTVAADAQLARVGIVTTLQGSATLTRTSAPQGVPLKPRDDVFVADRIVTGENALARILLGGKAVVTVRERSALTISESPHTATIDVSAGKIALAVVKERMKAGEQIEIRTPNAVAGIRGTVVITEVSQVTSQLGEAAKGFTTTITVLTGAIEVRQLDGLTRQPVGAGVLVTASQAIRITGAAPPRPVQPITTDARQRLGDEFKLSLKDAPAPPSSDLLQQTTNTLRGSGTTSTGTSGQTTTTSSNSGGTSTSSGQPASTSTTTAGPSPTTSSLTAPAVTTPAPSLLPSSSLTATGSGSTTGSGSGSDNVGRGDDKSGSNRGPSQESQLQKELKSLRKRR